MVIVSLGTLNLKLGGTLLCQEMAVGGSLCLVRGQGNGLQQHGVACILERGQHLRVSPEYDALRLQGTRAHLLLPSASRSSVFSGLKRRSNLFAVKAWSSVQLQGITESFAYMFNHVLLIYTHNLSQCLFQDTPELS